ncbi:MAG: hypothetical protein HOV71_09690 [Hamadaea sp.]|nr:hypothetical protein [Hamadaea sp.]NUR48393.1 hypothetical protein [Hamadaea sp.]NUT06277.1 hypothetical protein [Hamadaea sp.]
MPDKAELLRLVRDASLDADRVGALESALFAGGLHPDAPVVVGALIEYAAAGEADDAESLLLTVAQVVDMLPEPTAAAALRPHRKKVLGLLAGPDPETTETAAGLLGSCGVDPALAARLRVVADAPETDAWLRSTAMVSAARLDPAAAARWLPAQLDSPRAVAALDAMRTIGLPPPPTSAAALARAWAADSEQASPHSLTKLVRYVGDYSVLPAIAGVGDDRARSDVASALGALHALEPLSPELTDLLLALLDDSAVEVRRRAYQVVVFDAALSRRAADRLATDLSRGDRARPGAMYALIDIGDDRWQPFAGQALREGWAPPNLSAALVSAGLPWAQLREGVLRRIEAIVAGVPMPIRRRIDELRNLVLVADRSGDATARAEVGRLLERADEVDKMIMRRAFQQTD